MWFLIRGQSLGPTPTSLAGSSSFALFPHLSLLTWSCSVRPSSFQTLNVPASAPVCIFPPSFLQCIFFPTIPRSNCVFSFSFTRPLSQVRKVKEKLVILDVRHLYYLTRVLLPICLPTRCISSSLLLTKGAVERARLWLHTPFWTCLLSWYLQPMGLLTFLGMVLLQL